MGRLSDEVIIALAIDLEIACAPALQTIRHYELDVAQKVRKFSLRNRGEQLFCSSAVLQYSIDAFVPVRTW
eukprot:scaffold32535_cov44-Attheya_sp.AAC.5